MGSVQQITLGVIILGAAFILGHYVNQQQSSQELAQQSVEQDLDDATVWQKRPAPIKTMSDDSANAGSFVDLNKQTESAEPRNNRLALNKPVMKQPVEAFPNIIQPATQEVEPDFSSLEKTRSTPPLRHVEPIKKQTEPSQRELETQKPETERLATTRESLTQKPKPVDSSVLQPFTDSDFAPQLKDHFANRLTELRKNKLGPGPDDSSSAQPEIAKSSIQPTPNMSSPQLAPITPIESTPGTPSRDSATSELGQLDNSKRRLVPFRLNDEAQNRLVAVSSRQRSTLRVESTNFRRHLISKGETLQQISSKYYGKPDYYLDIYIANQDRLQNPTELPDGLTIKIPIYQ